ncbi:MAG: hypothetical protein AB7V56_04665 [Candidatus Nitrosocosmicus sp.]
MNNCEPNDTTDEVNVFCIFCGKIVDENQAWSHIDGDANMGVKKIEYFCSEEHKAEYFQS